MLFTALLLALSLGTITLAQQIARDPGTAGSPIEVVHLYNDEFVTGIFGALQRNQRVLTFQGLRCLPPAASSRITRPLLIQRTRSIQLQNLLETTLRRPIRLLRSTLRLVDLSTIQQFLR